MLQSHLSFLSQLGRLLRMVEPKHVGSAEQNNSTWITTNRKMYKTKDSHLLKQMKHALKQKQMRKRFLDPTQTHALNVPINVNKKKRGKRCFVKIQKLRNLYYSGQRVLNKQNITVNKKEKGGKE